MDRNYIFPRALLGSNVIIIAYISFSVTWKDLILLTVQYEKDGKQLALSIGVHIEAKKLLKMFAFLQKFETTLPSIKGGGVVGKCLLQGKQFTLVQYIFGKALESANDLVIIRI